MKLQTAPFAVIGALLIALFSFRSGGKSDALSKLEHTANHVQAISISLAKPKLTIGQDNLTLNITTSQAGYLTLVQRGTDGSLSVVFPNTLDADNRLETSLQLPRTHWRLRASGPAGKGRLLAVITPQPVSPTQANALDFGKVYAAVGADYEEIAP
jgi:hypothetical protein